MQAKRMNTKGKHQKAEYHVFKHAMTEISEALGPDFGPESIVTLGGEQFTADEVCRYIAILMNAGAKINDNLIALAEAVATLGTDGSCGLTAMLAAVDNPEFEFIRVSISDATQGEE